jgi:hypothetical protein
MYGVDLIDGIFHPIQEQTQTNKQKQTKSIAKVGSMQIHVPYGDARRSLVKSGARPNGLDCDATWRWCVWGGGGCETTQVITSNRSVNGSEYKATLVNQCHGGNLARSTKSHRELQSGVLKEALKARLVKSRCVVGTS